LIAQWLLVLELGLLLELFFGFGISIDDLFGPNGLTKGQFWWKHLMPKFARAATTTD